MQAILNPVYLKDYQAPDYIIEKIELILDLDKNCTKIKSTLQVKQNTNRPQSDVKRLILNGAEHHQLISLSIDDIEQDIRLIQRDQNDLIFENLPAFCIIKIENILNPEANVGFEGLYLSQQIFCTDCEPQGFRKITYFQDRPDNMAIYTVKIIADISFSDLLSNGNLIETGVLDTDRHYAVWHDPFPKPSYLFAIVAGDLHYIEDHHIRPDGSKVRLRVYAKEAVIHQCHFALASLKKACEWDEKRFNLICDLDVYNVVAVDDFNGGAMENKGLNIFNTKYVLADSLTATDSDFEGVESVIAHEYFHNWTGNRVTCRDWFQLSLKEGLTVFRDQEFSSDLNHRGLQRINDVYRLKAHQFVEDASALAHSVRPDHYIEMRNFYTTTVYEKGAEVVRLYQTLLGQEGFRAGMDLYFKRFDGMAVTCDDFLQCMREANTGRLYADLPHFERWYAQAGTPEVRAFSEFDAINCRYILRFQQILNDSPNQPAVLKKPQLIPIKLTLYSSSGQQLMTDLIVLQDTQLEIIYENILVEPIPSLFQEFSAPVIFNYPYTASQLLFLAQFDQDAFNRFDAAQRLMTTLLLSEKSADQIATQLTDLFAVNLAKAEQAPAFFARLLTFPDVSLLMEAQAQANKAVDPQEINQVKQKVMGLIAFKFKSDFLRVYDSHRGNNAQLRALKNIALEYLSTLSECNHMAQTQYDQSINMTDRFAALKCAVLNNHPSKNVLLQNFYDQFKQYPLVIDKWFSLQASDPNISREQLIKLSQHVDFKYSNPNRMRALIGSAGQNNVFLHTDPILNFAWLGAEILKVDAINPQIAARLATPFSRWHIFVPNTIDIIQNIIVDLLAEKKCSMNLFEQLSKNVRN